MNEKDDNKEGKSFWGTLPGILTGIASILTALAACLTIFLSTPRILDYILPPSPTPVFPREEITPSVVATSPSSPSVVEEVNISGVWRDVNYGTVFQITRQGNVFEFTGSNSTYSFSSSGRGTISGYNYTSQYETRYQNGITATGTCSGTISSDGTQITGDCNDPVNGKWQSISIRTH